MSEEYGPDIITVTDEEGQEINLEHLDTVEIEGTFYLAFVPADMDPDDPDYGIVILREEESEDESYLAQIEDEDTLNRVFDIFMERLYGEEDGG